MSKNMNESVSNIFEQHSKLVKELLVKFGANAPFITIGYNGEYSAALNLEKLEGVSDCQRLIASFASHTRDEQFLLLNRLSSESLFHIAAALKRLVRDD